MKKKNSLGWVLGESRTTFDMVNKPILKGIFNSFPSPPMQYLITSPKKAHDSAIHSLPSPLTIQKLQNRWRWELW